jgi:4-hydroxy-3-polyprenylbenzoate decarboxylase
MMFNKILIAAPAGFPIRDPEAVLRLLRGIDPTRDLIFGHGVLDVLDHATATPGVGGKLLIDCTRQEGLTETQPVELIFDDAATRLTDYEKLWLGLANMDPVRDITIADGKVTVDCRAKNSGGEKMPTRWPNVVVMDEATVALVDSRWTEYGITSGNEPLPSPSNRYRKLLLSDAAEA